ncbi:MAG: hypothetical protein CMJ78_18765 [Planctomycetaceae bacterium]|nr:hypothetical protein [Planctomycetaceae bacterium]
MSRNSLVVSVLGLAALLLISRSDAVQQVERTSTDRHVGRTNVADFGAIPGDDRDDTQALSRAISACKGNDTKVLFFPGGRYDVGELNFPPSISVEMAHGAVLQTRDTATVKFDGPFLAGRYQVFLGNGNVRFGAGSVSEVLPQWWGASPQSSDSSPAINKAINSAPELPGLQVKLSGQFNCQTTIHINRRRVNLVGDGMYASRIQFNPKEPSVLFDFAHSSGSPIVQCGIRDIGMVGVGSYPGPDRVQKTGIRIEDADILEVHNVAIHNWGGNGSVGIQVQGRQLVNVDNVTILADLPILIDKNPNIEWIAIDHSTFRNTYLLPMDANGPSVKIASGVALHNVVFDGTHAWVGGKYGLRWVDTDSKGVAINLSVKNVRMENGTAHGGSMIHIEHNYGLHNLILENIYGCGGGVGGIHLRKCTNATMKNIFYTPVRGKAPADYVPTALNIDESCSNVAMINTFWNGGKVTTGKLIKTLGTHTNPSRYDNRVIEVYDRPNNGQGEGVVIYGTKTWSRSMKLADGESLPLPVGTASKTKVATVTVAASDGADVNESAQFMVGGNGKTIKVTGTKSTSEESKSGSLYLISDGQVKLTNRLGASVDVVVTVFWQ